MKKFLSVLTVVAIAVLGLAFAACGKPYAGVITVDSEYVVIKADLSLVSEGSCTLKSYMDELQEAGEISYVLSGGMVTEIDGKRQVENTSYWMLYTDDAEHSDASWGTIEYNGETYNSALLGVESLIVKDGCTYIWYYQTF